jgi:hypothetical protein
MLRGNRIKYKQRDAYWPSAIRTDGKNDPLPVCIRQAGHRNKSPLFSTMISTLNLQPAGFGKVIDYNDKDSFQNEKLHQR